MQLIKWNPARDLFSLRHNMNNLFDDFFYPSRRTTEGDGFWSWNPAVDIYEQEDNIVVKAEIPGMEKDQITVDVKDRVLTLKGERSEDREVNEERYFKRERTYGRFERAFTLPADVKTEQIKAEYKDGVLKVLVPKPEVQKPKQITVH
ncbi:MAG: Hsp20/alpha crystallin family protein [Desulfobacteraceae bacterium]|jgi:HSP20 family protein